MRSPRDPDNRVARLTDLEEGESYTECARIALDDVTTDLIASTRDRLRNLMAPVVQRAKDRTGSDYSLEATQALLGDKALLIVVAATRWTAGL